MPGHAPGLRPALRAVGGTVRVEVERGGQPLAADIRVQDLHAGGLPARGEGEGHGECSVEAGAGWWWLAGFMPAGCGLMQGFHDARANKLPRTLQSRPAACWTWAAAP